MNIAVGTFGYRDVFEFLVQRSSSDHLLLSYSSADSDGSDCNSPFLPFTIFDDG